MAANLDCVLAGESALARGSIPNAVSPASDILYL